MSTLTVFKKCVQHLLGGGELVEDGLDSDLRLLGQLCRFRARALGFALFLMYCYSSAFTITHPNFPLLLISDE